MKHQLREPEFSVLLDTDTGNTGISNLQPEKMLKWNLENQCHQHANHAGMRHDEYMPATI